ncbi:MAG: iron ABC transporter permease [Pyrobaculum sp.]|nr:iron ABC transporter permease [Pyrobaculum sp.]
MRRLLLLAATSLLFSAAVLLGPAGVDLYIIETVRLPRALGAVVGGVLLGVSGLLLQTALRNPLADPYVLGVSGVAILTALGSYLLWRLLGMPYLGFYLGALIGALAATMALLLLASRAGILVVLMMGVLLSYASFSLLQLMLLALPPEELGYIYVGLQGSFAAYPASVPGVVAALVALAVIVAVFFNLRHVAALIHGEEAAAGLGVNAKRAVMYVVGAASVGVGVTVASVGPVGFIGLLAPHMARWLTGRHRADLVFLETAGLGAALALAADLAVRLLLPRELPVNVLLSLVGAPAAGWLLWRYVRKI